MTGFVAPLVSSRSAEPDAISLAGSDTVVFDRIRRISSGSRGTISDITGLPAHELSRLTAPRPDICGLSMDRTRIMGILNVTPDSFSDGGTLADVNDAVTRARVLAADSDILDIGGESTRPGADDVSVAEEIRRTVPVIAAIRDAGLTIPISIDTRKAAVADAALAAGATMVNDVTAFRFDADMAGVVAAHDVPVCLMHSQGAPKTMQDAPQYHDVVCDVMDHLAARISAAIAAGVDASRLIIDPGIGFGKDLSHNMSLLRDIGVYHDLGVPVLIGASRKRFIGTITGADEAAARLAGSVAVALHAAAHGIQIVRVHDPKETRQALAMQRALSGDEAYG